MHSNACDFIHVPHQKRLVVALTVEQYTNSRSWVRNLVRVRVPQRLARAASLVAVDPRQRRSNIRRPESGPQLFMNGVRPRDLNCMIPTLEYMKVNGATKALKTVLIS